MVLRGSFRDEDHLRVAEMPLDVRARREAVAPRTRGVASTQSDREAFRKLVPAIGKDFADKVPDAAPIIKAIQDAK